ncbi:MAG: alpha/beta fold hydrolase, partial [Myxococcota bacterium]
MRAVRLFSLLTLLFSPTLALAISEQDYKAIYDLNVMPYYLQKQQAGTFEGVDGVPIHFVKFPSSTERAALVLLPGRTESHIKYAEVFFDLRDAGFTIYAMDHRGQGFSGRTIDHPQKQHVKRFQDYVEDVRKLIDDVVRPAGHQRIFILAHSMGAGIATALAESHPDIVDAMVLLAPMHEMVTGQYPEDVAALLAAGYVSAGQGEEYALGNGDRKENKFEENKGTHSEARFTQAEQLLKDHPDLVRGGVTFNWAHEAIQATKALRNDASKLTTPVLIFTAGDDQTVRSSGHRAVCESALSCERIWVDGALHEMLMEKDEIRDRVLNDALRYLADRIDGIPPKTKDAPLSCQT